MRKSYNIYQDGEYKITMYTEMLSCGKLGMYFDEDDVEPEIKGTVEQFEHWRIYNSENYDVVANDVTPQKFLKQHTL